MSQPAPPQTTMKRALDDAGDDSSSKKQRTGPMKRHYLRHRQPGALLALAHPQDHEVLDHQMDRALSVALHSAGFNAVKTDAFESLRGAVHQYMTHFSSQVARSMHSARRRQPEPHDFSHALGAFGLRLDSTYQDLKVSGAPEVTQPALSRADASTSTYHEFETEATTLVGKTFGNGEKEKRQRGWVPKHLPSFPPVHTYKATAVVTERETDARRVRERATEEGVLAEKALRRLVAARKPSHQRSQERRYGDLYRQNEEAFRDTMKAVLQHEQSSAGLQKEDQMLFLDGAGDPPPPPDLVENVDEDFGMTAIVNWDQSHWRQRAARDILGAS